MVGTSFFEPRSSIAEVREITRSARTLARSAMISSVSPSAKYAFSGSGLRFSKGRTTIGLLRRLLGGGLEGRALCRSDCRAK